MKPAHKSVRFRKFAIASTILSWLMYSQGVMAFATYDGCESCHGSFPGGNYTSLQDGTNWGMPLMDGHEAHENLRQTEWGKNISVIMLTARSQAQDISRAKACDIEDYIIKPFDLSELLEKIESILEHKKSPVCSA